MPTLCLEASSPTWRTSRRMSGILDDHQPHVVLHATAHKQVLEVSPFATLAA